ncbi:3-hydroxyisobutyryl-coenzyme A hydrolase [Culex quinquefasciatus]|uniref:3-hydroxyisobutyryl-CoA hydrolase, mitochondrial n=1 Tax=Culex quinquefasciatus TaxID=7176 RepID=B0WY25_CULQU|nr:3-hydroxyisobutyryl-coenzyme A hydrolase [Culex quinquefasciatus]|eukprot:XP_001862297.1 3-hydroxyisobutyryl-coenzyme A hydrolase [Culex quinquefasciatus]
MLTRNLPRTVPSALFRAMSSSADRTVLCEEFGPDKGVITLNRLKALNAINLDMVRQIYGAMRSWQGQKNLVIVKGAGEKSFCAGGDVRSLVEAGPVPESRNFFREEYNLNALIGSYKPDYVAMIDGITMKGRGWVVPPVRVPRQRCSDARDRDRLFQDVGGGLTGFRLKGKDVAKAGIATHYVESKNLEALEKELLASKNSSDVAATLDKFNVQDSSEFVLAKNLKQINACFSGPTVESILAALEADGSEWAQSTLKTLAKMSPLSMKVTKKQLDLGRTMDLRSCLRMEFRMAVHCLIDSDFKEGVRALLIDRDQSPKWKPTTLGEVTEQQVDRFFGALPDGDELLFEDEVKANM